jgi:acyl-ACP thioesterase
MTEYRSFGHVDVHDVDYNGIARASSILKYMQTAAEKQLSDGGLSYDVLKDEHKKAFFLSRLRLDVLRPLTAFMPYSAVTYACESRGYTFLRGFRLECEGETVAEAVSVWALVDTETRGLIRVNDFELGLETSPAPELLPARLKLPSLMKDVGGYGVHYGDVDQNMHMNNTKYPDMYSNFLPLSGKMIRSISINYSSEAQIGDKLRVQRGEADGYYYFRTVRSDGRINSEAQIELCDI